MVSIARRNLFQGKMRFVMSSGGVALAIMLILILNGFYAGLNRQVTAYLDNTPIDLIVAQKDLKNFVGTNSRLPYSDKQKISKIKGVEKVIPVFVSYAVLEIKGRKIFDLLIGFDPKIGGGPWEMVKGTSNIKGDEMIYDETSLHRSHLKIGDKVSVLGKKFKIVSLSGGTTNWMTATSFINFSEAAKLKKAPNSTGFFLIKSEPGTNINQLQKRIEDELPQTSVVKKNTMAQNDVKLFSGTFSKPILFMVAIAFLIGLILVGFTIYTATIERSKEYGVLKAVGMKNLKLYKVVFEQAFISSLAGFVAGVALSFFAVYIIGILRPQFLILIEPLFIAEVFPLAVLISILASYLPIRVIAKLDPAIAFSRGV